MLRGTTIKIFELQFIGDLPLKLSVKPSSLFLLLPVKLNKEKNIEREFSYLKILTYRYKLEFF